MKLFEYAYAVPLGLSAICVYTDARYSRIYDKITIPMLLLGLIYSALTGRILESLAGFAIGFGIMLIGVLFGGAGGGDAKLAGALGAWMCLDVLYVMFLASIIGLIWGCIRMQRHGRLKVWATLFLWGLYCRFVHGMRGVVPMGTLPENADAPLPPEAIPFGVCLAAATWIVWILSLCLWRWQIIV